MTTEHLADSETENTGPLEVTLEVPDQTALAGLSNVVDEYGFGVQRVNTDRLPGDRTVEIDLDVLTENQRENLEVVVFAGYYEQPRVTDLATLAAHFEISKSAMSQRLRAAKMKLVRNALTE